MIRTNGSAKISACERYRYKLSRWWMDAPLGAWCLWVMLNPSTADALTNDQTIDTIVDKTWHWANPRPGSRVFNRSIEIPQFCGLHVANLYAYRSTDPMGLLEAEDPVGPDNDHWITELAASSAMIVAAWGNGPFPVRRREAHTKRIDHVLSLLTSYGKPVHMLELTGQQQPRHPLYTRADMLPQIWRRS